MLEVYDGRRMFAEIEEDVTVAWQRYVHSLRQMALRGGVRLLSAEIVTVEAPFPAWIHQNRWIVNCPDCPNQEMVWLDKRLLMCRNCWNGAKAHQWRRVLVPKNYSQIEGILKQRYAPENRNWLIGETAAELLAENVAHGIVG